MNYQIRTERPKSTFLSSSSHPLSHIILNLVWAYELSNKSRTSRVNIPLLFFNTPPLSHIIVNLVWAYGLSLSHNLLIHISLNLVWTYGLSNKSRTPRANILFSSSTPPPWAISAWTLCEHMDYLFLTTSWSISAWTLCEHMDYPIITPRANIPLLLLKTSCAISAWTLRNYMDYLIRAERLVSTILSSSSYSHMSHVNLGYLSGFIFQ